MASRISAKPLKAGSQSVRGLSDRLFQTLVCCWGYSPEGSKDKRASPPVLTAAGGEVLELLEKWEGCILTGLNVWRRSPHAEGPPEMIHGGSARIRDRVREFVSSVKEPRAPAQFGPCRLAQIVANVCAFLGVPAEQQGITLRMQSLDVLPLIQGDERQLFSMVYNLVHNAIPEVCANGSITIKGCLQEDGQRILVLVIDTGKGMSAEVKASLFTRQAVSRKAGGTDLGTKIVKDVVEAHGGKITVESERGMGTSFHILLPVTQPG
jgi:signal transduction histidine kinase